MEIIKIILAIVSLILFVYLASTVANGAGWGCASAWVVVYLLGKIGECK